MKRFFIFIAKLLSIAFILVLLVCGLNSAARGLSRLLPEAPPAVFALERNSEGQIIGLRIMDYRF